LLPFGCEVRLWKRLPWQIAAIARLITLAGHATIPNIAVASNNLPVKSIAELVSMARTQPGKLTFASSGPGRENGCKRQSVLPEPSTHWRSEAALVAMSRTSN